MPVARPWPRQSHPRTCTAAARTHRRTAIGSGRPSSHPAEHTRQPRRCPPVGSVPAQTSRWPLRATARTPIPERLGQLRSGRVEPTGGGPGVSLQPLPRGALVRTEDQQDRTQCRVRLPFLSPVQISDLLDEVSAICTTLGQGQSHYSQKAGDLDPTRGVPGLREVFSCPTVQRSGAYPLLSPAPDEAVHEKHPTAGKGARSRPSASAAHLDARTGLHSWTMNPVQHAAHPWLAQSHP